jgi:hypothetical protein
VIEVIKVISLVVVVLILLALIEALSRQLMPTGATVRSELQQDNRKLAVLYAGLMATSTRSSAQLPIGIAPTATTCCLSKRLGCIALSVSPSQLPRQSSRPSR